MNRLISSRLLIVLGLILAPMSIATNMAHAETTTTNQKKIWGCGATNGARSYHVDQLNPDENSFDLVIYQGNSRSKRDYIETVRIDTNEVDYQLVGVAKTQSNNIEVRAFGRTVAFTVEDSIYGRGIGRCYVQWRMADSETRRLVRQCLALADKKSNDRIAPVTEFGCETDPNREIKELQSR